MSAQKPDLSETSPEGTANTEIAPDLAPEPVGPGQAWNIAEQVARADEIGLASDSKEALSQRSETIAAFVDLLDKQAVTIGDLRISAFDVLFLAASIMLVITAAWFATRLARRAMRRVTRFDGAQSLLAEKLITIVIWVIAFFVTIDLVGIDLSALAIFGGAFGLAVGFGFQKTFGNLISGILLLLDKSIKPGDVISVTDQSGNEAVGQIRKIGIRAISVITRDQTEHLIPNENLMVNQVVNWSYSSKDVRVKAPVGVAYDSDLKLVKQLLERAVDETPRVLARPAPRVNLMGFGDSSVDFEIRFWINDPENGVSNVSSAVLLNIWDRFTEAGIDIPLRHEDVLITPGSTLKVEMVKAAKDEDV